MFRVRVVVAARSSHNLVVSEKIRRGAAGRTTASVDADVSFANVNRSTIGIISAVNDSHAR